MPSIQNLMNVLDIKLTLIKELEIPGIRKSGIIVKLKNLLLYLFEKSLFLTNKIGLVV
jgi:hypothetical protein